MGAQEEDCSAKCTVLVFKALAASGCRLDVAVPEGVTYSLGRGALCGGGAAADERAPPPREYSYESGRRALRGPVEHGCPASAPPVPMLHDHRMSSKCLGVGARVCAQPAFTPWGVAGEAALSSTRCSLNSHFHNCAYIL